MPGLDADTVRDSAPDPALETELARARRRCVALAVLVVLPVIFMAAALPVLPDTVAFHYGLEGPDDWRPKTYLFLPTGFTALIMLVVVGVGWASEKQRILGRPGLLIIDGRQPLWLTALIVLIMDAAMGWYVFSALARDLAAGADVAIGIAARVVAVVAVLGLWAAALLTVSGKLPMRVNFHPGTSDLERRVGADRSQQRAVGIFLLVIAAVATLQLSLALW